MCHVATSAWRNLIPLVAIVGVCASVTASQNPRSVARQEQTHFSAEQADVGVPVQRPVDLPDSALQVLRTDKRVAICRGEENLPNGIPARWFIASEIHLDGPDEVDLIVQPRMIDENPTENRCLFGANIAPFWVLRQAPPGYTLVLEIDAHDLKVRATRSKGYRDIAAYAGFGGNEHSVLYKFDGKKYESYQRKSEPVSPPSHVH